MIFTLHPRKFLVRRKRSVEWHSLTVLPPFLADALATHLIGAQLGFIVEVTFGVYEYAWIFGFTHSQQLHSSVTREWTQRQNAARALSFG
ncbi:hypothetical protein FC75_GL002371 [Lacticaseibacillus camelliae DSM 22697 = JCM 13995]|uniref:Uncharacterized protein n=1 Tax=Lacticaseibacillus camelliae DSM 22697 = JCM 13995 TaxID=1423730 RepID=A0A0R2EY57_9LACO|nr:hypothetical protein FC75_GL002371 [Lacticaseibacillus camelliae DSM 22697 = JCM 13995]